MFEILEEIEIYDESFKRNSFKYLTDDSILIFSPKETRTKRKNHEIEETIGPYTIRLFQPLNNDYDQILFGEINPETEKKLREAKERLEQAINEYYDLKLLTNKGSKYRLEPLTEAEKRKLNFQGGDYFHSIPLSYQNNKLDEPNTLDEPIIPSYKSYRENLIRTQKGIDELLKEEILKRKK